LNSRLPTSASDLRLTTFDRRLTDCRLATPRLSGARVRLAREVSPPRRRDAVTAEIAPCVRVDRVEERDQRRDNSGPPGLMARTEPRAVVAVEILVEQQQIAPVRVVLERRRAAVHSPPAVLVAQEDVREPCCDLFRDVEQVHPAARSARTLHGEV